MKQVDRGRRVPCWCFVILAALSLAAFSWGLGYKLSLYDSFRSGSHRLPQAKLTSKHERLVCDDAGLNSQLKPTTCEGGSSIPDRLAFGIPAFHSPTTQDSSSHMQYGTSSLRIIQSRRFAPVRNGFAFQTFSPLQSSGRSWRNSIRGIA